MGIVSCGSSGVRWSTSSRKAAGCVAAFGTGRGHELTPRNDRHAETPRGPWAVASVSEGFKIGDIIPISDTSEWVSLGCGCLLPEAWTRRKRRPVCTEGQEYRNALGLPKCLKRTTLAPFQWCETEGVQERGSSGTPWRSSRRSIYDDRDLGDDIRTLLRLLERMNRDGMIPVGWTEAYFIRKKYGDGDRSQHDLKCIARVCLRWLFSRTNST